MNHFFFSHQKEILKISVTSVHPNAFHEEEAQETQADIVLDVQCYQDEEVDEKQKVEEFLAIVNKYNPNLIPSSMSIGIVKWFLLHYLDPPLSTF